MPLRPLPTVIGSTENALRILLRQVLEGTMIDGYVEWVYLNSRAAAGNRCQVAEQVAEVLREPLAEVQAARRRLGKGGLLDRQGALTPLGEDQLRRGRDLVGAMTRKLTDGIHPEQLEVAREVLDVVRLRAEDELS